MRLLCPWNSPGKSTGVGSHSFLQGIFPTQIIEPGLLHCRQILYIWTTREALNNTGLPHNFQSDFTHISLISFLLNRSVVSNSLQPHGLYSLWNSPGQNTGVGCHFLLQWIFPIQGLNPHLLCFLNCRWILYPLSCGGSSEHEIKMDRLLKEAAWWDWYDKDEG